MSTANSGTPSCIAEEGPGAQCGSARPRRRSGTPPRACRRRCRASGCGRARSARRGVAGRRAPATQACVVAQVRRAVERAAGIGVGAAGVDDVTRRTCHAGPPGQPTALRPPRLADMLRRGGRRRTVASPTRSGPEGSSRSEFRSGRSFGLPPFPAGGLAPRMSGLFQDTRPDAAGRRRPTAPACSATPPPARRQPPPTACSRANTAPPASTT